MIKKESMKIVSLKQVAQDTIEMVLQNHYISHQAVPGQFLHIAVPGHTLRRPISIAAVDQTAQTVTILFKKIGSGTESLATFNQGDILDVLGPSGNGFPIDDLNTSATVLLVGGGIGVPPLYFLGSRLKEIGINVQAVIGFQSKDYVFYEKEFKVLGDTIVVTDDGSYGEKGFVTNVVDQVAPFERYYSCGPLPMLQAVTKTLGKTEGYLSFEERMGCGVGACFACVVPTETAAGYKKICQDGPVFPANEVII